MSLQRTEMERRRLLAAEYFKRGSSIAEVARMLQVSHTAVSRWKVAFERDGLDGLKSRGSVGQRRLSERQLEILLNLCQTAPGFWTVAKVSDVAAAVFGVHYCKHYLGRLLAAAARRFPRSSARIGRRGA